MEDEQNELKIGNQLRFTCSFNRSKPKPQIIWFVDGKEVSPFKNILSYCRLDHPRCGVGCWFTLKLDAAQPETKLLMLFASFRGKIGYQQSGNEVRDGW